jgi:hypothetical protein
VDVAVRIVLVHAPRSPRSMRRSGRGRIDRLIEDALSGGPVLNRTYAAYSTQLVGIRFCTAMLSAQ